MALSKYKLLAKSQAVRKFTDREHARDAFASNLQRYLCGDQPFKVLTFYGAGGIGKSSLLRELKRSVSAHPTEPGRSTSVISLDLDSDHLGTAADVLYAFRRQWDGRSPLFEFALARYWELQGRSLEEIRKQVIREGSLLFDLVEASADIADIFVPATLLKKLLDKGLEFFRRHGNLTDRFDELVSLDEAGLAERLPALLGEEIERWAQDTQNRLLVFVDGYDRLSADSRYKLGKYNGDGWLRELIGAMEVGLHVFAGRHVLKWDSLNPEWSPHIEQHAVGPLSDEDASEFLAAIPVRELEIREAIVRSARGLPLYLDLCASIYVIRKDSGYSVQTSDLHVAEEEVIERFLTHLDPDQVEAVRI